MAAARPPDLALRLREAFDQLWPGNALAPGKDLLRHAAEAALTTPGKLLRGRMLLEVCSALGGKREQALPAAVAIEYLHLGTLIHDDLIDRDELRRGRPAIWKRYGDHLALLSGDFLYFAAFRELACSLETVQHALAARVLSLFSLACMDLCLGQAREEEVAGQCSAGYEQYLEIARLKTARLFRVALEIGTLLGGGSEPQVEAAGTFAEHLGIAFQLIDDRLPFVEDSQTIGKGTTSDIRNHRVTAPILFALARVNASDRQVLQGIYEEGRLDAQPEEAYLSVREILARTGALQEVEKEAMRYYHLAVEHIHAFSPAEGRERLLALAHQFVYRKR
jgi:geranylgeranyl diphosphate synthase type I